MRFFEERCQRQGIYIFDEPESALSPSRQMEFLKLMRRMENSGHCQIIMATHSPMLMAYPGARLLRLTKYGLDPVNVKDTDHYQVMREFCEDPAGFVEAVVEESITVRVGRISVSVIRHCEARSLSLAAVLNSIRDAQPCAERWRSRYG